MKKSLILFIIIILTYFSSGCISRSQEVTIKPEYSGINFNNIGKGKKLNLKVYDDRIDKYISRYFNNKLPKISIKNDVEEIIHNEIRSGLKKMGFNLVLSLDKSTSSLIVVIVLIELSHFEGLVVFGTRSTSIMKVVGSNDGHIYEKTYKHEEEKKGIFYRPSAKKNEELINKSISSVIEKIFLDINLMTLLANK